MTPTGKQATGARRFSSGLAPPPGGRGVIWIPRPPFVSESARKFEIDLHEAIDLKAGDFWWGQSGTEVSKSEMLAPEGLLPLLLEFTWIDFPSEICLETDSFGTNTSVGLMVTEVRGPEKQRKIWAEDVRKTCQRILEEGPFDMRKAGHLLREMRGPEDTLH